MVLETRVFVQILPRIVFPIYAMVIPETLKFIANNPAPKFRGTQIYKMTDSNSIVFR